MKVLYIDCAMGCAGDMLTAALLELIDDKQAFLDKMNRALGGKCIVSAADDTKCGIRGTHVTVMINGDEEGEPLRHEHKHTSISEVLSFIDSADIEPEIRADARAVYELLAEAESKVHGGTVENIHFHEVGSLDALADVLNVCALVHEIAPDKIIASPVNVGGGFVKCAHGVIPVPAPATELLLSGVPTYSGEIKTELCTPTGAALLRHFAAEFKARPAMAVSRVGYGTGKKDLPAANVVRALLGESNDGTDDVIELKCNLDDMTAEELAFACSELLSIGALDVYQTSIGMKKGRMGVMLTCMCHERDRDKMLRCIFKNTTTIGVREYVCRRYVMQRSEGAIDTALGAIRVKRSSGYGVEREKLEYDDLAEAARRTGKSLREVRKMLKCDK